MGVAGIQRGVEFGLAHAGLAPAAPALVAGVDGVLHPGLVLVHRTSWNPTAGQLSKNPARSHASLCRSRTARPANLTPAPTRAAHHGLAPPDGKAARTARAAAGPAGSCVGVGLSLMIVRALGVLRDALEKQPVRPAEETAS